MAVCENVQSDLHANVCCFVISLKRADDRRALMRENGPITQLNWAFFDAIDAKDPSQAEALSNLVNVGPWGEFFPGDKACTLSHYAALEAFLRTDASYCLILEDDVFLSHEVATWLSDTSWWPQGADIVRFERWRAPDLRLVVSRKGTRHLGRDIRELYSRHSGTAGYVIRRDAAEKVLRHQRPNVPIDHLLFNKSISPVARQLKIFQVLPGLVQQGNEPPTSVQLQSKRKATGIEPKWRRDARRGWYEVKLIPWYLWLVASRQAVAQSITFR